MQRFNGTRRKEQRRFEWQAILALLSRPEWVRVGVTLIALGYVVLAAMYVACTPTP